MIERPLEALARVCDRVAVVCKRHTALPGLPPGVERWEEPDEPRHPLTGIVHALQEAAGLPVVVCGADMPFVQAATLALLLERVGEGGTVVGRAGGRLQPLLAVYDPAGLPALRAARADAALTATVEGLAPVVVEVPERDALSIDTPEALRRARAELARRG
jgi:molybdopterin-guanine dinucleotide biosynthesis protein A